MERVITSSLGALIDPGHPAWAVAPAAAKGSLGKGSLGKGSKGSIGKDPFVGEGSMVEKTPGHKQVVQQVIRYAASTVGQVEALQAMLITIYVADRLRRGLTVPFALSDDTFWLWTTYLIRKLSDDAAPNPFSTVTGRDIDDYDQRKKRENKKPTIEEFKERQVSKRKKKPPSPEDLAEKQRRILQTDYINNNLKVERTKTRYQVELFRDLEQVFDNQFKPLFLRPNGQEPFDWPDTEGMAQIIHAGVTRRVTNFNNSVASRFLSKQQKVLCEQITRLPSFSGLPLTKKSKRAIRNSATKWSTHMINRWTPYTWLETVWKNHARTLSIDALKADLTRLVQEHQAGFGPQGCPLSHHFYRLSAEDCKHHGAIYLNYFHYLYGQYDHFNGNVMDNDDPRDISAVKKHKVWKFFNMVPQVRLLVPFIDINVYCIPELVKLTSTERFGEWYNSRVGDGSEPHVPLATSIPLVRDGLRTRTVPLFTYMFGPRVFKLCAKQCERSYPNKSQAPTKYLSSEFTGVISTDGQQAKVHCKRVLRTKPTQAEEVDDYLMDVCATTDVPTDVDPTVVTKAIMDEIISSKKTVIAVDPGHEVLITAVRYDFSTTHLSEPKYPKGTTNSKTIAKWDRRAESNQSVCRLTNLDYQNHSGHTYQAKKIKQWRDASGLSKMDQYLRNNSSLCAKTTMDMAVYSEYVRYIGLNWGLIWHEATQPKYKKLRFETYQKEQKQFKAIADRLLDGRDAEEVVIWWGGGKFGPTSRGHAAAPNKKLREQLQLHIPDISVVSEWGTTKNTPCCHQPASYHKQTEQLGGDLQGPLNLKAPRGLYYCNSQGRDHRHAVAHFHNHSHDHGKQQSCCDVNGSGASVGSITGRHTRPWNRDVAAAINIFFVTYLRAYRLLPDIFNPCNAVNQ